MSTNPKDEGIVPLRPYPGGAEGAWSEPAPVEAPVAQPQPVPAAAPEAAPVAQPQPALFTPPEAAFAQPVVALPAAVAAPRRRGWVGIVSGCGLRLILA